MFKLFVFLALVALAVALPRADPRPQVLTTGLYGAGYSGLGYSGLGYGAAVPYAYGGYGGLYY